MSSATVGTINIEDSWKGEDNSGAMDTPWIGCADFYELGSYPQVYERGVAEESRLPHQAPTPKDLAPEERELHI